MNPIEVNEKPNIPLSELAFMDATSVEDCARLIGVSRALLYNEIKGGRLTRKKLRGRSLITKEERQRYLDSLSDQTAAQGKI